MLLASTDLEHDREHRVRGLLQAVTAQASEFTLAIRPFRQRDTRFGELTVRSTDST